MLRSLLGSDLEGVQLVKPCRAAIALFLAQSGDAATSPAPFLMLVILLENTTHVHTHAPTYTATREQNSVTLAAPTFVCRSFPFCDVLHYLFAFPMLPA